MPSHYVRGCERILSYVRDNKINISKERLCASLGIPIIHMNENDISFRRRISEPQSEALADLMGLSLADCRTETGMQIAP